MYDQLRICGLVFESATRSWINFGTMRMRWARVKFPQSERLQPARLRTLSEGSCVKGIRTAVQGLVLAKIAHPFNGPLAHDGVRIVLRIIEEHRMNSFVGDATAGEHTEKVDSGRAVLQIRARAIDQHLGGLVIFLPAIESQIDICIRVAHAQVALKIRSGVPVLSCGPSNGYGPPSFRLADRTIRGRARRGRWRYSSKILCLLSCAGKASTRSASLSVI